MRVELKQIEPIDVDHSDALDCSHELVAHVGIPGEDGAILFYFWFVTCRYLKRLPGNVKKTDRRSMIVVDRFDFDTAAKMIRGWCDSVEGRDWDDVARKLRTFGGRWEYEGMEPVDRP